MKCFHLDFTVCHDYFIYFEASQLLMTLGGANMEDPQEKQPGHPQAQHDVILILCAFVIFTTRAFSVESELAPCSHVLAL